MEQAAISPWTWVIVAVSMVYLTSSPGVFQGLIDTYFAAPLARLIQPTLQRTDVIVGKQIAQGGFGTVYVGTAGVTVPGKIRKGQKIIIKKAIEFGEAEVWMNERLSRTAPDSCATFLTAYPDGPARVGTPLVLVWKFEGKDSLYDAMQQRDFPTNLEQRLLGRQLRISDPTLRAVATIKVVMRQLLENLAMMHATGIVHRDVKPQNMIISDTRVKMIDLGAAADLRVGINYVPNEYLLDPRFAPPQQYVMSPLTPKAPAAPLAALLSPVLWRLNQPDRFDMYSAGIVLLQLAFPNLRTDNALVAFNQRLEELDYDLRGWRASLERRKATQFAQGFAVLDAEDGAGWELLCKLLTYKPNERYSAAQALKHRWFTAGRATGLAKVGAAVNGAVDAALVRLGVQGELLDSLAGRSDMLSEVQLYSELSEEEEAPAPPRNMPRTVAWWQARAKQASWGEAVLGKVFKKRKVAPKKPRIVKGRMVGNATQRAFGAVPPPVVDRLDAGPAPTGNGSGSGGSSKHRHSVGTEESVDMNDEPAKAAPKAGLLSLLKLK